MAAVDRAQKPLACCWRTRRSPPENTYRAFRNMARSACGAPITAYNRISNQRCNIHSNIYEPDYVVVVDEGLHRVRGRDRGLEARSGAIIINTRKTPEEIRPLLRRLCGPGMHHRRPTAFPKRFWARYFPNTPMLAATVKVSRCGRARTVYGGHGGIVSAINLPPSPRSSRAT